jgi:hypothetical protein
MLLSLFATGVAEGSAADPLASAANAIIQTGVLGALLVIVGVFAFYMVTRVNKVNDLRVKDQKEAGDAMTKLSTDLMGTMRDFNGTANALREAVVANTTAANATRVTLDSVIRDAVRGVPRRMTPAAGMPATGGGGSSSRPGGGGA